jgi:hypothetical protein
MTATVQDVSIAPCRFDILVSKQFLDRPAIRAVFQQMRGKRVAQGRQVVSLLIPAFRAASLTALEHGFTAVMAPSFTKAGFTLPREAENTRGQLHLSLRRFLSLLMGAMIGVP